MARNFVFKLISSSRRISSSRPNFVFRVPQTDFRLHCKFVNKSFGISASGGAKPGPTFTGQCMYACTRLPFKYMQKIVCLDVCMYLQMSVPPTCTSSVQGDLPPHRATARTLGHTIWAWLSLNSRCRFLPFPLKTSKLQQHHICHPSH